MAQRLPLRPPSEGVGLMSDRQRTAIPESLARRIFEKAIADERAGELLEALFDGGSVTLDARTGGLLIVSADVLGQMDSGSEREGE